MNSLYGTPITGMQGADFGLDVTANNIANLNTSGYEAVEPILVDLPAQAEIGDPNNGIAVPAATHVGMGAKPSATVRDDAQAPLVPTGNPLDLAIDGPGFIAVQRAGRLRQTGCAARRSRRPARHGGGADAVASGTGGSRRRVGDG